MKSIKNLVLLLILFAFIGCTTTESTSVVPEATIEDIPAAAGAEIQESKPVETLIERYISGEIPGYGN